MTRIGNYLLDTNIIIALFAADPPVLEKLAQAEAVFIPSIALGELYYGAQKSARPVENTAHIVEFSSINTVLDCDEDTARFYGAIKNDLRAKGRPLPENDIWIGAISQQHELILATRDRHFAEIVGLSHESW
ncbi:MAG: type II toxin-antitoxin system VapC family toxin [Chloroflexota bacterium]